MKLMLQLRLLGAPEVLVDGSPVTEKLPGKAQAILYYLAGTGQVQTRTVLATLLWGDMPEPAARTNLRKALAALRRELDPYLQIERQSVAFHPEIDLWVDAVEFETILGDVPAEIDPERLQRAVDLYQGDFLTGFYVRNASDFESWMYAEQGRLRELMIQALHLLAHNFAEWGDLPRGIASVRRLLTLEPWREEAHRLLMLLLAQDGQRGAALAQYESCRQVLAEELGVEPGPETVALCERIRDGVLSRGTGEQPLQKASPRSRGETFTSAPWPSHTPAAPVTGRPAAPLLNLPQQPTPFVGREKELADIIRRLIDRDCRLLTLVGPGGIGKTRLALQTAHRFVETGVAGDFFPHGLIFVSLAGVSSTSDLVSAIAQAANFSFYSSIPPRQQLLDYLKEKKMLLLLDNLEHMLTAPDEGKIGGAELIAEILATAPAVKILVTSREVLNLQESWFHPVQGMSFPHPEPHPEIGNQVDPQAVSRSLERYDAVRLFVQSARRARIDFSLAAEQTHVVRICQLVEGMPLAIELAAAWLKVLPAEKIYREIERSLDFLTTSQQNVPERQRSIRAVFEHSWQLLRAEEREVLKRLSVFKDSFTEEAAGQVAEASLPILAGLVERSLLRVAESGRYQLHELLRQFAGRQLEKDPAEETATRDRHFTYFIQLLQACAQRLRSQEQEKSKGELLEEINNLRQAWNWAVDCRRLDWLVPMIPDLLWLFEILNYFQEAAVITLYAADSFRSQGAPANLTDPEARDNFAFLLGRAGFYLFRSAKTELGRSLSDEGLSLIGPAGKPEHLWYMTVERSYIELSIGNLAEARHFVKRAVEHAKELNSSWHLGFPLIILGIINLEEGHLQEAYDVLRESLTLWIEVGDPRGLIFAYTHLGAATLALEKIEESLDHAQKSISLSIDINDRWSQANGLSLIGQAQAAKGKYEAATVSLQKSADLHREIGDLWSTAQALVKLGDIALELGKIEHAKAAYLEALPLTTQAVAIATGLSAVLGLVQTEARGNRPAWAHSLAAYVAGHPQANEYTKKAARQACAEIKASFEVGRSYAAHDRFQGYPFEEVVHSILADGP